MQAVHILLIGAVMHDLPTESPPGKPYPSGGAQEFENNTIHVRNRRTLRPFQLSCTNRSTCGTFTRARSLLPLGYLTLRPKAVGRYPMAGATTAAMPFMPLAFGCSGAATFSGMNGSVQRTDADLHTSLPMPGVRMST